MIPEIDPRLAAALDDIRALRRQVLIAQDKAQELIRQIRLLNPAHQCSTDGCRYRDLTK